MPLTDLMGLILLAIFNGLHPSMVCVFWGAVPRDGNMIYCLANYGHMSMIDAAIIRTSTCVDADQMLF